MSYIGGGLTYTGLWEKGGEDVLGFAVASAILSDSFRNSDAALEGAETTFELTYHYPVTGYFAIQPDIQVVHNPSADSSLDDAVVLGVRTELAL